MWEPLNDPFYHTSLSIEKEYVVAFLNKSPVM